MLQKNKDIIYALDLSTWPIDYTGHQLLKGTGLVLTLRSLSAFVVLALIVHFLLKKIDPTHVAIQKELDHQFQDPD